jgi:hypothetical protein
MKRVLLSAACTAALLPRLVFAQVGCPVIDAGNLAQTGAIATQTASQASTLAQMTQTTGALSDAMGSAGGGSIDNIFSAGSVAGGLNAAAGDLNSAASSVSSGISGLGSTMSSGISSGLNSAGQALGVGDVGSGLGDVASGASNLGSAVKSVTGTISAANNLVNAGSNAAGVLNNAPNNALNAVTGGAIGGVNNGLSGAAGTAGGSGGLNSLVGAASGAASIGGSVNGLANNANALGTKLGNVGSGTVNTPSSTSVSSSLRLPFGNGNSVGISSLSNLSGSFTPTVSLVSQITAPGLSAAPAANFSTVSNSASWVNGTFFTPSITAAATQAIAQRRNAAVISAAQAGYAVALTTRANAGDADKRAQALLQAGNKAQDLRGQLATLQTSLTVLQGEMATSRVIRASQLEIQAAAALRDSPSVGTP